MLNAEKKFIDKILQESKKLPPELLVQEPRVLFKVLRKRLRMNQKQLAKRSKISQSHIAKIEAGKLSPSFDTLQKLALGLGCKLALVLVSETPPDLIICKQALLAARKKVGYVAGTMALEQQRPLEKVLNEMILVEQQKLLNVETSEIWDYTDD